jgi:fatty acid desaturase
MTTPKKYVDQSVLNELQKLETWKTAVALSFDWAVIATAIGLSEYFGNWGAYFLAIIVIAGRMHAIASLIHEFAHVRFVTNPTLNDWIGDLTAAWPLFTMVHGYRKNHFQHHKFYNTEKDPDYRAKYGTARFTFPQKRVREVIFHLLGYIATINSIKDLKSGLTRLNTKSSSTVTYKVLRIGVYAAALALLIWFNALDEFALYWLVPYLTFFMAIMYVRSVAEHFAIEDIDNKLEGTRTVVPAFWERAFFGPHQVSYHLEHHIFPYVPFYNLPKLHAALMSNPEYRARAHITYGYFSGLLGECLRHGNYRRLPALELS